MHIINPIHLVFFIWPAMEQPAFLASIAEGLENGQVRSADEKQEEVFQSL